MGLGVYFGEDIAHILRGVGEGVRLLAAQREELSTADAAYVAGYWAALRAVSVALGLATVPDVPPIVRGFVPRELMPD